MNGKMAVIGVGNMAKAIINGMLSAQDICAGKIALFDRNEAQYEELASKSQFSCASSIADAVEDAELVLLSVKPQNFPEVLKELRAVPSHKDKIYISIAAGLSSPDISGTGICSLTEYAAAIPAACPREQTGGITRILL